MKDQEITIPQLIARFTSSPSDVLEHPASYADCGQDRSPRSTIFGILDQIQAGILSKTDGDVAMDLIFVLSMFQLAAFPVSGFGEAISFALYTPSGAQDRIDILCDWFAKRPIPLVRPGNIIDHSETLRNVVRLLSACWLISGNDRVTLQPLVHLWAQGRLDKSCRKLYWMVASCTVFLAWNDNSPLHDQPLQLKDIRSALLRVDVNELLDGLNTRVKIQLLFHLVHSQCLVGADLATAKILSDALQILDELAEPPSRT